MHLRRLSAIGLFAAVVIAVGGVQAQQAVEKFTFAAMSDSRGAEKGGKRAQILAKLCQHSCQIKPKPDFMVFVGDMVEGSKNPDALTDQLTRWQKIIDSNLSIKLIPVVGNHEVKSLKSQTAYTKFFPDVPANGPADEKLLTYYFDHKNSRFIILDTNYFGDQYRIRHMDWLEEKLKQARDNNMNHIFVFGHSPAFQAGSHLRDGLSNIGKNPNNPRLDYIPKRDAFWSLLKKYNVTAYLCGHEHKYARQNIKGLWQITTGGGGAPLYSLPVYPGPEASEKERKSYEKALPYYKILNIPHGPGQLPLFDPNGVCLKAYHYVAFEVDSEKVVAKVYGTAEAGDKSGADEIKLLDEFVMYPAGKTQPARR